MAVSKFDIENENEWCPGCGNFSILQAMKKAFITQSLEPKDILIVSGIGQAGKTPHFMACNMLHGLHGRALPLATGAKIANHRLNIIVNSGDGDCYGEGGNHFLAAIRRNIDITLLVHNNRVYGLTKGQASPTSPLGRQTEIQYNGTVSSPFNPIATALAAGAGFVAKGFSGNIEQLSGLIVEAMNHKGFSMIDIDQPCVSFNKINTHLWYKARVFDLKETGHDVSDYEKALRVAHMGEDKIPTGVIYKADTPAFHERVAVLKHQPLFDYGFDKARMDEILAGV
ncbi:MAG: thiamine pyrophosphate-dependent enzyme [Desulfobacula sp.]|jgi:2-oxoglutarate ferredoxin oxidoreductase subunit beta